MTIRAYFQFKQLLLTENENSVLVLTKMVLALTLFVPLYFVVSQGHLIRIPFKMKLWSSFLSQIKFTTIGLYKIVVVYTMLFTQKNTKFDL